MSNKTEMSKSAVFERRYKDSMQRVKANFEEALSVAQTVDKGRSTTRTEAVIVRRACQNLQRVLLKLDSLALQLRREYDSTSYRAR